MSILSNGHVGWFAGPDSAISANHWVNGPTLAELQTLVNYSAAIKIDGTSFNVEASESVEDRSFADDAGSKSRGVAQASGSLEVYTPGRGDSTSVIAQAWATFATPRTRLALLQRPIKPQAGALAAGDVVNVFRVITDGGKHNKNDASRTAGLDLKLQDNLLINYIVPSASPSAVALTPSGAQSVVVGTPKFLKATYEGHNVTAGATYVSSDESILRVTTGGILIGVAAGTATLTVTVPGSAAGTPVTITVTAA